MELQSGYEEGLTTAEGDSVTETRETDTLEDQPMLQLYNTTDGEFRDGVDSVHENNNPKSDSNCKRMFLSAKSDDDVLRLIATAAERDSQEQIERLEKELKECEAENQILQAELKRKSLPKDKQMRSETISQLSREHAADGTSRVEENLPGPLQASSKQPYPQYGLLFRERAADVASRVEKNLPGGAGSLQESSK